MAVVVGTAGHIDHGKTTLLRALTRIDADRLPEERRRGMTIDVGYAHLDIPDGPSIDFVDVPGHHRLVGNMLVGAGEIDAALLVVAADEGPRAQTVEHLELLDALGITAGVVAVTKLDVLEPGDPRRTEVPDTIRQLLAATTLASAPIVLVSAERGDGLAALRAELESIASRLAPTPDPMAAAVAPPRVRLAVDRAFAVGGRGPVVTGTLRGGSASPGMALRLLPDGVDVRIREVQVHGTSVPAAGPGRTALNLSGIEAAVLRRGLVATDDPAIVATDRLLVALRRPWRVGAGEDAARAGADSRAPRAGADGWAPSTPGDVPANGPLRLHLGTDQVGARLEHGARWVLDLPSGERIALLRLDRPVAAASGDRFVLRRPSPAVTVAGGLVLDAIPPRGTSRRRATPERIAAMAAAPRPGPDAILDLHGALALDRWRTLGVAGRAPVGPLVLAPDVLAELVEAVRIAVAAHHAAEPDSVGVPLPELRRVVARELRRRAAVSAPDALAAAAVLIDGLVMARRLGRSEDRIRDPRRADVLPPTLAAAMDRLETLLATPAPPSFASAMRDAGCTVEGVRRLEMSGRLVRLGPDLAFAATTYRELEALALSMAQAGPLSPAAFRDATGTSRRYVLAVLEDLDRRGLLVRTPEGHRPAVRP